MQFLVQGWHAHASLKSKETRRSAHPQLNPTPGHLFLGMSYQSRLINVVSFVVLCCVVLRHIKNLMLFQPRVLFQPAKPYVHVRLNNFLQCTLHLRILESFQDWNRKQFLNKLSCHYSNLSVRVGLHAVAFNHAADSAPVYPIHCKKFNDLLFWQLHLSPELQLWHGLRDDASLVPCGSHLWAL